MSFTLHLKASQRNKVLSKQPLHKNPQRERLQRGRIASGAESAVRVKLLDFFETINYIKRYRSLKVKS